MPEQYVWSRMPQTQRDALVAEKVLGWQFVNDYSGLGLPPDSKTPVYISLYSTDISSAWRVVEHMTDLDGPHGDKKWSFGLEFSHVVDWVADFTPRRNHEKARQYPAYQASATTAPEAICLAALKACGVNIE